MHAPFSCQGVAPIYLTQTDFFLKLARSVVRFISVTNLLGSQSEFRRKDR